MFDLPSQYGPTPHAIVFRSSSISSDHRQRHRQFLHETRERGVALVAGVQNGTLSHSVTCLRRTDATFQPVCPTCYSSAKMHAFMNLHRLWIPGKASLRRFSPSRILFRLTAPLPPGLWLLNLLAQRVLRINGHVPWMVHFTSCVSGDVQIGRNVWKSFAASGHCYIAGLHGIRIGDDTIFAPGVQIQSANHVIGDLASYESSGPVIIGCRCWIGANAVILPGVILGDDVVVGAGAVVTKGFPGKTVLVGVPAHPITH